MSPPGSPKLRAFLGVEASIVDALDSTLPAQLDPVVGHLHDLLRKQAYGEAEAAVQGLSVSFAGAMPRLEELAVSAYLFGASRFVPLPHAAALRAGVPDSAFTMLHNMVKIAEQSGADLLRARAMDLCLLHRIPGPGGDVCPFEVPPPPHALDNVVFLRKEEMIFDIEELSDAMNRVVLGTGKALVDLTGNLVTSRLTALGALHQAQASGVSQYRWNTALDDRVCPVCAIMEGRIFDVGDGVQQLEVAASLRDKEDLKAVAPWPSQSKESLARLADMIDEEIQMEGFAVPPLHPFCRCVLSPLEDEGDEDDPAAYPEDLLSLLRDMEPGA